MSQLLQRLCEEATARGVFGAAEIRNDCLHCGALHSAALATYRVHLLPTGGFRVALATSDRWLSESIETDLLHLGESMEELVSEELCELGAAPLAGKIRHFRNDEREYVFEHDLPASGDASADERRALDLLLGFEAAFRLLGDMAELGEAP
ncbi:MAG: hypothetical protein EXS00_01185 [Phycisphaerales bacterium]|nr:hypothetical protein [Phycisphaerales bacterium]